MNRISPIFTSREPAIVMSEIDRLGDLFKNQFRKSITVDLLFASWGDKKDARYGITLTYEDGQGKDAAWVRENVKESITS